MSTSEEMNWFARMCRHGEVARTLQPPTPLNPTTVDDQIS